MSHTVTGLQPSGKCMKRPVRVFITCTFMLIRLVVQSLLHSLVAGMCSTYSPSRASGFTAKVARRAILSSPTFTFSRMPGMSILRLCTTSSRTSPYASMGLSPNRVTPSSLSSRLTRLPWDTPNLAKRTAANGSLSTEESKTNSVSTCCTLSRPSIASKSAPA